MYQTLYYQGIKNYRIYNPEKKKEKKERLLLPKKVSIFAPA